MIVYMKSLERLADYFLPRQETKASRRRTQGGSDLGRRRFLYILGGGAATAIAGTGTIITIQYLMEQAKVDALIDEYKQKESQMEPLIQKFEQGFGSFMDQVLQLIEKTDLPEDQKKGLQIPFEIFKINKENPDRNTYLFRRKSLEQTRSRASTQGFTPNANFFFYDFLTSQEDTMASFLPPTRTTYLSPKYDPNNILDNLIAMHEFIHVAQDNEDRQVLPYPIYIAFFSTQPLKTNGLYETTAYIKEIYLLNLFTQNQFRQDVTGSQGKIDSRKYLTILHARSEQAGTIELLAQMAYRFYNGRSSLTGIDSNFLSYVNSIHRSKGIIPYMRTPNGYAVDPN